MSKVNASDWQILQTLKHKGGDTEYIDTFIINKYTGEAYKKNQLFNPMVPHNQ